MKLLGAEKTRRQRAISLLRGDGGGSAPYDFDDPEVSSAELQEFLAADSLEDEADPEFKEELRTRLWTLVRARYGPGTSFGN